ncbi:MAG: PIN domain-containing protein [Propionibacteriaceae bacterium]|nr:PIN domain-containing protein [Propionibacteriaceae bacterium]
MALMLLGQGGAGKVEHLLEQEHRWRSAHSSVLLEIELVRVARRTSTPVESARTLLAGIELLEISREVVDGACALTGELKSLDAIHLASALILHSDADPVTVLTHDARLAEAARARGLAVVDPLAP